MTGKATARRHLADTRACRAQMAPAGAGGVARAVSRVWGRLVASLGRCRRVVLGVWWRSGGGGGHRVPRGPMWSAPMSSQIKVAVRKQSFLTAYNTFTPRWLAPEHAGRHGMQHPATRQAERTQATKARRGHERAHAISQLLVRWGLKDPGRSGGILRSLRSRLQCAHPPPNR